MEAASDARLPDDVARLHSLHGLVRARQNRLLTMQASSHRLGVYETPIQTTEMAADENARVRYGMAQGRRTAQSGTGSILAGRKTMACSKLARPHPCGERLHAMNKCPKCGHEWPDSKRASGGKARWRGMSKAQRKQAASNAAKARWANRPNDPSSATRLGDNQKPK